MAERPILFSGPMVRAILAGTKTQTRRVVTPPPEPCEYEPGKHALRGQVIEGNPAVLGQCPYGAPGDRLWVRETFAHDEGETLYAADCPPEDLAEEKRLRRQHPGIGEEFPGGKWRPSIFMPRWASRLTLEVTAVRVERLQDISEEDAIAEGVEREDLPYDPDNFHPPGSYGFVAAGGRGAGTIHVKPQEAFAAGWDELNAKRGYGWASTPWVWVIAFRRVQP